MQLYEPVGCNRLESLFWRVISCDTSHLELIMVHWYHHVPGTDVDQVCASNRFVLEALVVGVFTCRRSNRTVGVPSSPHIYIYFISFNGCLPRTFKFPPGRIYVGLRSIHCNSQIRQYFMDESFYVADRTARGWCDDDAFPCEAFSPSSATVKVSLS